MDYLNDGDSSSQPSRQPRKQGDRRGKRGPGRGDTVKTYILKAFAQSERPGPLTVAEIYEGAVEAGWTTTSSEPKTILRTNLRRMVKQGTLISDAGTYMRAPGKL